MGIEKQVSFKVEITSILETIEANIIGIDFFLTNPNLNDCLREIGLQSVTRNLLECLPSFVESIKIRDGIEVSR